MICFLAVSLFFGCCSAQTIVAPSGKPLYRAKCSQSLTGCYQQATRDCAGGSYQIVERESHAGGLLADILPGPVTWYTMSYTCGPSASAEGPASTRGASISIPMKREGGVYVVPVLINNAITLDFVVDSGASDVTIPSDVVSTLVRAGTLSSADFIGKNIYRLADGSTMPSPVFRIRSLKVGNTVVENIAGSVAPVEGSLLLGQSFLSRFKSWSIDNSAHALLLGK
jgi:clan AA aspartic protease (TIGR02281 family)